MGWKGWQTFLTRAATLTCRPNVRGVARSWRRPRPRASVSQQCRTSLKMGLKCRVKKNKQTKENKTFSLPWNYFGFKNKKIWRRANKKSSVNVVGLRLELQSPVSAGNVTAGKAEEKTSQMLLKVCQRGPPVTGKANSASGKVEIMENVEMKVSSAIFSPHDSKIAPF